MQVLTQEKHREGFLPQVTNSEETGPHTSIFIPINADDTRSSIRTKFKKLCSEAKELLTVSMDIVEIEAHMKPVEDEFSFYREFGGVNGLAFFRSKVAFFHTSLKIRPPELVVVAGSFHVKPLMHCISSNTLCYILTIASRQVKLYKLHDDQICLLKTYADESDGEEMKSCTGFTGQRKRNKEITEKFVHVISRKIVADFNLHQKDLAILGPKHLRHRIKSDLASKVHTNVFFESAPFPSINQMSRAVNAACQSHVKEASQEFVKRLLGADGNGLITNSLYEIAEAAVQGRIERLVIDPSIQVWGLFNRIHGLISTHPQQNSDKDDCVIDDITEEVIKKGGEVVFFNSTSLEKVAPYMATLRW